MKFLKKSKKKKKQKEDQPTEKEEKQLSEDQKEDKPEDSKGDQPNDEQAADKPEVSSDDQSNHKKEDNPEDSKEDHPNDKQEDKQEDSNEDQPSNVKEDKPDDSKEDQPEDQPEEKEEDHEQEVKKEDQPSDEKEGTPEDSKKLTKSSKESKKKKKKEADQPKEEEEKQLSEEDRAKEKKEDQPSDEKEDQPEEKKGDQPSDEKDDHPKIEKVPDASLEKLKNNDKSFKSLVLMLNDEMDLDELREAMKGNTSVCDVQLQVDPSFTKWDEMLPLFQDMGSSLEGLKYLCLGTVTSAAVRFSVIPIDALAALLTQAGAKLCWLYVCGVRFTHHHVAVPDNATLSPTESPEEEEGETESDGDEKKATKEAFEKLGQAFQAASNLTKMSMMCQLGDDLVSAGCTLDPIVDGMGKMSSLETAVLCVEPSKPDEMDRIPVGDKALKHLFQCPSLKQLRMSSLEFDEAHIKAMANGMSDEQAALEEVFISAHNTATEPCGTSVGALFRAACNLNQLTMEEYKFDNESLVTMSIALASGDHRMEQLDISCRMEHMGSLAMSQMLMVNKSLKKLRLHDIDFDNDEHPLQLIKTLAKKTSTTKATKNLTLDTLELVGRFPQDAVDENKIKKLHSKKRFSSTVTKETDTTCIRIERIVEKDVKDENA